MKRRTKPRLESLEQRELLAAGASAAANSATQFSYTTPQGAHVSITLYGQGTLAGTSVEASGALDLVYTNTTANTGIIAKVEGGGQHAFLASIHDSSLPINDLSGVGGHPVGIVNLKNFDLIPGGNVNLTAGVSSLFLNAMGSNAEVHVSELPSLLPTTTVAGALTPTGTTATNATGNSAGSGNTAPSNGTTTLSNPGGSTFNPVGGGAGNGNSAGVGGLVGFAGLPGFSGIGGTNSGTVILNAATAPFVPNTTFGGVSTAFLAGSVGGAGNFGGFQVGAAPGNFGTGFGGFGFTGIGTVDYVGNNYGFAPGRSIRASSATASTGGIANASKNPGFKPSFGQNATGVDIVINHVNATAQQFPAVGDAQIFGYDATQNSLIRFDAVNGSVLQTIPLSTPASAQTGVSLARVAGQQLVLVGSGTGVQVFNASTGGAMGSFSTLGLAAEGFTAIEGLGSTETATYLIDSTAGSTGMVQRIDVGQSLATGQAMAIGTPYSPAREFFLTGGATSVPAKPVLYLGGAGYFKTTQPSMNQNGVLAFGTTATNSVPRELARAELPGPAAVQNAGNPPVTTLPAMGSLEQNLAIVTSVVDGKNVVSLYSPQTLAQNGSVTLNDANPLTDLSSSFHPELANTALVDVQGNSRSFRALDAKGLVINENGFLNLVQIERTVNSEVIGHPVGHTRMPFRKNVLVVSTSRSVGSRGGVVIAPRLQPLGPLSLPNNNA